MKKILYTLIFGSLTFASIGQQTPVIEHYLVNQYFINPAAAGLNGNNAYLDYRKQWQGFQGAPETQVLAIDGAIRRDKFGVGLMIVNDQTNILGSTGGYLSYAYKVDLTKTQRLRFGVSAGLVQNRIIYNNIIAEDPSEAQIFENNQNATNFDVNAGVHYQFKEFSLGFATNHLFPASYQYENNFTSNQLTFSNVRHFVLNTQYNFNLKGGKWAIQPCFLTKGAQGIPFIFEGSVTGTYKKQVWSTLRYSHGVGYTIAAGGVIAKQLILAYSYGISSNRISSQNSGTHEILLGYKLLKNKGGGGLSSAELKKIEDQSAELFEKIDYLNKENEVIKEELESQKKLLKEKIYGLEELKAELEKEREAREKMVLNSKYVISDGSDANQGSKDVNGIGKVEQGSLYVIVGATRKIEQAKEYQELVKREYDLDTRIIRNSRDTWFLIYTKTTEDNAIAQKELKHVKKINTKDIYVGKPWVYKN